MSNEDNLLDIESLSDDYDAGANAMGHYTRGYYLVTDRGMESLQTYATKEYLLDLAGANRLNEPLREVKINTVDDDTDYSIINRTNASYLNVLADTLQDSGFNINSSNRPDEIYRSVIEHVYNHELDKNAFVEVASDTNNDYLSEYVTNTLKHDIVRSREGNTDARSEAAVYAYYNDFVPNYKTMAEDSNQSIDESSWMSKTKQSYVNRIIDDDSTESTIDIRIGRAIYDDFVSQSKGGLPAARENSWVELMEYLDDDIVIMFEEPDLVNDGFGLIGFDEISESMENLVKNQEIDSEPETFRLPREYDVEFEDGNGLEF